MWLVIGLGNPGRKYQGNRHNAGFMVVDELARRHRAEAFRSRFGGELAGATFGSTRVQLLKPMEFMNHSGFAASRAAQFFNVAPEEMVVIHDEADLDFGRLKLKSGGGHGGHNGLRSLLEQLPSGDFPRVRVGVGKPRGTAGAGGGDRRVANYLLSDFAASEAGEVEDLISRSADAVEAIVRDGIRAAMNDFNKKPEKPAAEAPAAPPATEEER